MYLKGNFPSPYTHTHMVLSPLLLPFMLGLAIKIFVLKLASSKERRNIKPTRKYKSKKVFVGNQSQDSYEREKRGTTTDPSTKQQHEILLMARKGG